MSRLAAFLVGAVSLGVALVTALWPQVDMDVARLFYCGECTGTVWPVRGFDWAGPLRWLPIVLSVGFPLFAGIALIVRWLRPQTSMPIRTSSAVYLVVSVLLGPVFFVNMTLKDHWGRPRPYQIAEFGHPPMTFRPWWQAGGPCQKNCSFISGETSGAAWLAAPASLAPPQWRPFAYAGVVVLTGVTMLMRMAFGGHFLSDAVLGAAAAYFIVYGCHWLLFRRRQGALARSLDQNAKAGGEES